VDFNNKWSDRLKNYNSTSATFQTTNVSEICYIKENQCRHSGCCVVCDRILETSWVGKIIFTYRCCLTTSADDPIGFSRRVFHFDQRTTTAGTHHIMRMRLLCSLRSQEVLHLHNKKLWKHCQCGSCGWNYTFYQEAAWKISCNVSRIYIDYPWPTLKRDPKSSH
jgi:hypothetical protein